jgi:hypothetical protein
MSINYRTYYFKELLTTDLGRRRLNMKRFDLAASLAALALIPIQAYAAGDTLFAEDTIIFPLNVSATAKSCLPNANGRVTVHTFGPFENMEVEVFGLPPNTGFDLFNIEAPDKPFGLAWYLGDIDTDKFGVGVGNFVGRFNKETFIISPGVPKTAPPNTFPSPPAVVPEATTGIATNPVQIYHLGLWFNSSADAAKAHCPSTPTPFNGEHNAGIQVLNTSSPAFPDNAGPLLHLP